MAELPNASLAAPVRLRIALRYGMLGEMRYLSHHDELRMLARALVRARWPVAYTQGFNPRPRLGIVLPRPVGLAARDQLALLELSAVRHSTDLLATLAASLPAESRPTEIIAPATRRAPQAVTTEFELPVLEIDRDALAARIGTLHAGADLDLVERIELDGERVRIVTRFERQRTARLTEILDALGLAREFYGHRAVRARTTWDCELTGASESAPAEERNAIGNEEENDWGKENDSNPTAEGNC